MTGVQTCALPICPLHRRSGWLALYEAASERVRAMFDEKFLRMWRLYLAGSVAAFSTGTLQLFQVVFATADNNDVPWTRAHLYTP